MTIEATIVFTLIAVLIIQGDIYLSSPIAPDILNTRLVILVLRTYYLYSHSLIARVFVICVYLTTTVASAIFIMLVLLTIEARERPVHVGQLVQVHVGCELSASSKPLWPFFIPSLTLHTILYCLTSYRAMTAKSSAPVLKRLRRECVTHILYRITLTDLPSCSGGLFYLVVLSKTVSMTTTAS